MTVDLRLAIPAGIAWIAVWVFLGVPAALPVAAGVCWALSVACAVLAILLKRMGVGAGWRGWVAIAIVIAAATAMVLSSAAVREQQRHPDWMTDAASSGRYVLATATTAETLHPGQDRFDATIDSVTIGGRTAVVDVPVTVFRQRSSAPSSSRPMGLGSTITLSGTLADTEPGESSSYLFFMSGGTKLLNQPPWFLDWANQLRAGFQDAAATLPGDGAGLLPGLAIGDTSAVSSELDAAMKSSSLSHLTAVSGDTRANGDGSGSCEQGRASCSCPAGFRMFKESGEPTAGA